MTPNAYIWLSIGLLFLVLLCVTFMLNQQAAVRQQQALQLQQKSMLQEKEYTLHRIAEDLHDHLGQMLYLSALHLKEALVQDHQAHINKALLINKQLIDAVKQICNSASAEQMKRLTLTELLQGLVTSYDYLPHLKLNLHIEGVQTIAEHHEQQVLLLRMLQEVVHNCVKHTNASQIDIRVQHAPQRLYIQLKDNHTAKKDDQKGIGMGLPALEARAQMLKASYHYEYEKHTLFWIQMTDSAG